MEWISVEERLPTKTGTYIVAVKNLTGFWVFDDCVLTANYYSGSWNFQGWEDNKVTHWMPLPPPPEQ